MDFQAKLPKLPVIDLTAGNLNSGNYSWKTTSDEVRQALEEYGCFVAAYDGVSPELHDRMLGTMKELFDLPEEIKLKNTSKLLGFGYGSNFSIMPLVEYFGIEEAATLEATRSFTDLMWPAGNDAFCETAFQHSKLIEELHHMVLQMVFKSYGVENYCEPLIKSSFYLMRMAKYRAPHKNEKNVGLHPHTDKSFMSIIDTNNVKGLEFETKGGDWIVYEPSPSTFVVVAGDPFMAWSNGRIHAPLHRVIMRGSEPEPKYTIGLFSFMGGAVLVPEELIDENNPRRYKSFDHLDFLQYCGKETKIKSPVKSYCGV